ncbi:Man1-Src1p-C-terminal domain-containing protein [Boletus edulis BED1]|uniref:Man1-Src1p-C-terminal domain-containing protein n=1 Tax=Boletus edulis BED1 TaxID=1328754 RepID=A0AAD4C3W4_BOLED|nr:Man1-Src1p-C-terminal domain-containing protein [Boletus edulis BED1]
MSRSLTATQIISQGDYLDNDFDSNTLTVSQLLGVLTHHQIRYPTPYTKAKLVQSFLDEIKPKVVKLRKERLKRQNSLASDDGITDGLTGRPLNTDTKVTRRSSRRLSRPPEFDEPSQRPEPPKRRRSSAQPDLGRIPRTKVRANVPALVEESEPEEEPPRETTRKKKEHPQTRRISLGYDSGWEENNIFQSGAESSPTQPSPVRRTTRKSTSHKKSRHSMSAPPQLSPPSSPIKAPFFSPPSQRSPPQSKFEPQLPLDIPRQPSVLSPPGKRTTFLPLSHPSSPSLALEQLPQFRSRDMDSGVADHDSDSVAPPVNVPEGEPEEFKLNEQVTPVSEHVSSAAINHHEPRTKSSSYLLMFLYGICFLVFSSIVVKYKRESASIGFCDAGSNSSRALQEFQAHISAIEPCIRANRTFLDMPSELLDAITAKDGTSCPPLSLIPLPHPSACTPCPAYAACSQHTVTCNSGYLLRPHPILALLSPFGTAPSAAVEIVWNFISEVADGLPGLGPVAFSPHCIEDPRRKRNIGALGKAIEALLGQERGRRVCAGVEEGQLTIPDSEEGEARKWGLEVEVLRETMKKKTQPHLLDTFDDTFNEAMQQLVEWGSVVFGEDMSGHRYLAHKTANLTLNCKLTVKLREVWLRWRATTFVLFTSGCMLYALQRFRAQRQIENKRVAELVQIALDTLRNQELAHHTDPVTAPQPYLSSLQLRDLILQEQHSISARKRLWDQVERVVEGNANVRVNLEEVQGGDEHRVWRWVGTAGRGPEYRKRVQSETEKGEGQVA